MTLELRSIALAGLSAASIVLWGFALSGAYTAFSEFRQNAQWYEQQYNLYRRHNDAFWSYVRSGDFSALVEKMTISVSLEDRKAIENSVNSVLSEFAIEYSVANDFGRRLSSIAETMASDARSALQIGFFADYEIPPAGSEPIIEPVIIEEQTGMSSSLSIAIGAVATTFALGFLLLHGREGRRLEWEMKSLEVEKTKLQVERMRRTPPLAIDAEQDVWADDSRGEVG